MSHWPKNITCECPEFSIPPQIDSDCGRRKRRNTLRERDEEVGEGSVAAEPKGSLPAGPEVWDPLEAVWPEH